MSFIITEPQRIDGTSLGYAIYPYHFSFNDHLSDRQNCNGKLMIFKLKDSPFIETEKILYEEKFSTDQISRECVDKSLKTFINAHTEYIRSSDEVCKFFKGNTSSNTCALSKDKDKA